MKVKLGGAVFDSASLLEVVETAQLVVIPKGRFKVNLLIPSKSNSKEIEVTRNQLVKFILDFQKRDRELTDPKRFKVLSALRSLLHRLKAQEEELLLKIEDDSTKKKLLSHQKRGNRFFNREKAFVYAVLKGPLIGQLVCIANPKTLTMDDVWELVENPLVYTDIE